MDTLTPKWVIDVKGAFVVELHDLIYLGSHYTSGASGWRTFDKAYPTQLEAYKALRVALLQLKKDVHRDWQRVRDTLSKVRILRKRLKRLNTIYNPNRYFLFMPEHRNVQAIYTDQISPYREFIGEIREWEVHIAGNYHGHFPKEHFFRTYEEAAIHAQLWFQQEHQRLVSIIGNIDSIFKGGAVTC